MMLSSCLEEYVIETKARLRGRKSEAILHTERFLFLADTREIETEL